MKPATLGVRGSDRLGLALWGWRKLEADRGSVGKNGGVGQQLLSREFFVQKSVQGFCRELKLDLSGFARLIEVVEHRVQLL